MKILISPFKQFSRTNLVFLLILTVFLAFNAGDLARHAAQMRKTRQKQAYPFLGHQFSKIEQVIGPLPARIGYMTDKDLSQVLPGMQFSQAQYVLAPAILDLNNIHHRYLLLDYSDKRILAGTVIEHRLIPLKQTVRGVILAVNPKADNE